jgi:GPH family glycoside/pentoside/hexuronide:cation symporter
MANHGLDRVPTKTKLLYGSGDTGLAFTDVMLGVGFMIFLMDVVGLNPTLAAVALLIGRSWDWISDPIVGYLSDRTRTRWGRRRPYILFGAAPFALSFAMIWWNPPIENHIGLAAYYSAAYTIYYTFNTIIALPYYALTPELTSDYDERTALTTYRMLYSLVGTGVGMVLGLSLDWSPGNQGTIAMLGFVMGIGAGLPFFLVFWGTRENPDYQMLPKPKLATELKSAMKNKPFLYAAGIILFTFLALETTQQMIVFFLKYYMKMESSMELISGSLIGAAILSLPFWNWVSEKLDKIKAYMLGALFMSFSLVLLYFEKPGMGLASICIVAALNGVGFGALQVLSWAIIPDTIEYDELETGERHEGMFYSLVTIFRKITTAFVLPLTGLVLGATGYVANSMNQNEATISAIRFLMTGGPILSLLIAILLARKFPITRKAFDDLRLKIAERKKEARVSAG